MTDLIFLNVKYLFSKHGNIVLTNESLEIGQG